MLDQQIGEAARQALEAAVGDRRPELGERGEAPARFGGDEGFEPPLGAFARRRGAEFAVEPDARREQAAADDLARRDAAPGEPAAGLQRERLVVVGGERAEPAGDLRRHGAFDRAAQHAVLQRRSAALGLEMRARQRADALAFDRHRAVGADAAEDRPGRAG